MTRAILPLLLVSCGPVLQERDCSAWCYWLQHCEFDDGGLYYDAAPFGCRIDCEAFDHPAMDRAAKEAFGVTSCDEFLPIYNRAEDAITGD